MRTVPQNTYVTVSMSGPTSIVEPCSPWRALAQSGISLKWEDPRPSGRGVCQSKRLKISFFLFKEY